MKKIVNYQMRKEAGIEALRDKPRHGGDRTINIAPMMDWTEGDGFDMDFKSLEGRDSALCDHLHPGALKRHRIYDQGEIPSATMATAAKPLYNPGIVKFDKLSNEDGTPSNEVWDYILSSRITPDKMANPFPEMEDFVEKKAIEGPMTITSGVIPNFRMSPERLKEFLDELTDEERRELFTYYCHECGTKDVPCRCWDDT